MSDSDDSNQARKLNVTTKKRRKFQEVSVDVKKSSSPESRSPSPALPSRLDRIPSPTLLLQDDTSTAKKKIDTPAGTDKSINSRKTYNDNDDINNSRRKSLSNERSKGHIGSLERRRISSRNSRSPSPTVKRRQSRNSRSPSPTVKRRQSRNSRSPSPPVKRRQSRSRSPVSKKRRSKSRSPVSKKRRSKSRSPVNKKRRSKSRSPVTKKRRSKSRSPVTKKKRSRSRSPVVKKRPSKAQSPADKKRHSRSRSPAGKKRRSRSRSPIVKRKRKSRSPARRKRSRSRSKDRRRSRSREQRRSPPRRRNWDRFSRSPSPRFTSKWGMKRSTGLTRAVLPANPDDKKPRELTTEEVEAKLAKHMVIVREKAAEEAKNINLPGYLNPAMVNVHQFKQVQDKRKLLWSKTKDKKEGATQWAGAFNDQNNDEKFKRFMGIQGIEVQADSSKMQKSREVLSDLEKEYEKSRAFQLSRGAGGVTGMGLGFGSLAPTSQ